MKKAKKLKALKGLENFSMPLENLEKEIDKVGPWAYTDEDYGDLDLIHSLEDDEKTGELLFEVFFYRADGL